jgi:hypothetical protein
MALVDLLRDPCPVDMQAFRDCRAPVFAGLNRWNLIRGAASETIGSQASDAQVQREAIAIVEKVVSGVSNIRARVLLDPLVGETAANIVVNCGIVGSVTGDTPRFVLIEFEASKAASIPWVAQQSRFAKFKEDDCPASAVWLLADVYTQPSTPELTTEDVPEPTLGERLKKGAEAIEEGTKTAVLTYVIAAAFFGVAFLAIVIFSRRS